MHHLPMLSTRIFSLAFLLTVLTAPYQSAFAQPPVNQEALVILGRGSGNVQVTSADVLSELRRTSAANKEAFLAKPDLVQQMVSNLLVRRVLATQAESALLDKDPVVAASLSIARDRILSDVRLAQLDAKNTPVDSALDTYARNIYQANPAKFDKPAQTRARHILLPNTSADALQKAKNLLAQLRAGASFEDLAKAHSTDSGSAAAGGDLGFFAAGKMVKPFEEALDKLTNPGDLSEPVETQFGYHIIRLEERQAKVSRPYLEVQAQLKAEALASIIKESRSQLSAELNQDFIFDTAGITSMGKTAAK